MIHEDEPSDKAYTSPGLEEIQIKAIWTALKELDVKYELLNKRLHRLWQQVEKEGLE